MSKSLVQLNQLSLGQIYQWLGKHSAVTMLGNAQVQSTHVNGFCTDSRKLQAGDLFIAIVGENHDAHDFVVQAQEKAAAVIVERWVSGLKAPAFKVSSSRHALGEIAAGYRAQFSQPLITVAGSNGKTTIKEMLASVLAEAVGAERRLSTKGNLNNDLGVPFTLFDLAPAHQMGVVELGMNHPGEIAWISSLVKAQVALVNNAQREHQEFMESVEATAIENGASIAALDASGTAVFPFDDACAPVWRKLSGQRKRIEFGLASDFHRADQHMGLVIADPLSATSGFNLRFLADGNSAVQEIHIQVAIDGLHNVRNALAASASALAIGISLPIIAKGLAKFQPAKGRLVRHVLSNNALLIDDSYNANPDSVRAAIQLLSGLPRPHADLQAPRVLVLGDMGEVGTQGEAFHREIGEYAKASGIEFVLLLGEATRHTRESAGAHAEHFDSVEALIERARELVQSNSVVLVKGSRFMRMERVVQALAEVKHAA